MLLIQSSELSDLNVSIPDELWYLLFVSAVLIAVLEWLRKSKEEKVDDIKNAPKNLWNTFINAILPLAIIVILGVLLLNFLFSII